MSDSDYSPLSPDVHPRNKRVRRDSHAVRMMRAVELFIKAATEQTLALAKSDHLSDDEIRLIINHRFREFKKSLASEDDDEDYVSERS